MRLAHRGVPPEGVLRAVETMDRACLALCEGQYMDLEFQDQTLVTSASYFHMVELKSGTLAGCSAQLGALAAGAPLDYEAHFKEFGRGLGSAWQIMQDVADMWGQEGDGMTPSNALNKKKGLPLVHALETSSPASKRQLANIYVKRVLEPEDLSQLVDILDQTNSRQFAEAKARELAGQATAHLENCGLAADALEELNGLAEWVLEGGA